MAQKSSKFQQGATTPIQIKFDGGLNYAQSPTHIADNELTRALNIIYNSQTGTPETRSGTSCVTATALPAAIRKIYYYEKSATSAWLLAVSGLKLYRLDTDHWHEIGTDIIASTTVIPTFLTYNTYLLIADGSTNLRKWDGTTLSSLTDGLSASAIAEVGARVVINSTTDSDLVTFSGIEDETMWDTADLTNPALGIRAGFGDNMIVNAFAVFKSDLMVSKTGDSARHIYRINTVGVPSYWTADKISANNAAQNAHTFVAAFNNVFFVDTDGFKSIKGITEYGDLEVDVLGGKVNAQLSRQACFGATYVPAYTSIWLPLADRLFVYHQIIGTQGINNSFTELQFKQGRINDVLQSGEIVYLAGDNGYLYCLDETAVTDEISPNTFTGYPTAIETKRYSYFGGGILKKTSLEMQGLTVAGGSYVYLRANTDTMLKEIPILTSLELSQALMDLADATMLLASLSSRVWIETTRNRIRSTSIQFQIDSVAGRFGIEGLTAEVALVEG